MQHHATLYIGSLNAVLPHLPSDVHTPGADVQHIVCDRLSIADVRTLIAEASRRPVTAPKRSFVLSFFNAPHEAQNALLKTLEEPTDTAVFYIVVPQQDVLMPTVLSRLMQVEVEAAPVSAEMAQDFFAQSYKDKMQTIASKIKEQDISWIDTLLASAEHLASETKNEVLMHAVVLIRTHVSFPGASKKMLLEYLVLAA